MEIIKNYKTTKQEMILVDSTAESFAVSLCDGIITIRNKKPKDERFRKCFDISKTEFLEFVRLIKENLLTQ